MATPTVNDPYDNIRRGNGSREPKPVTDWRRWQPWAERRAVVVGTPDSFATAYTFGTDPEIISIIGTNKLEVIVSQPESAPPGGTALDATGVLTNITDWSGRLLVAGGRYNPDITVPVDELMWAEVNRADFPNMGTRTFAEHFNVGAYFYAMFQIYDIAGVAGAEVYVSLRPA